MTGSCPEWPTAAAERAQNGAVNGRRPLPIWLKIVIGALVGVLALFLYAVGSLWFWSDGSQRLAILLHPAPDPAAIEPQRQEMRRSLEADLALVTAVGLTPGASNDSAKCYRQWVMKGYEGYAPEDRFLHRCTQRLMVVGGHSGDFRTEVLAIEDALTADGWRAEFGTTMDDMLREYHGADDGADPEDPVSRLLAPT